MVTKVIMDGCHFEENGVAISLPEGWDGTLDAKASKFIRNGVSLEIRGSLMDVPQEVKLAAVEAYKRAIQEGATPNEAAAAVSENSRVKEFLRENGVGLASLGAAVAQLVAQLVSG